MKILIVSGFLGAGKTTFIKELIRKSGIKPVILENEYGENDIDASQLRQDQSDQDSMQILEFMEGCVCCTMKDSFVNSVLTIFSGLSPEYLIIEPTGVGKLSNILENLQPILHDNIELLKPVVILSLYAYQNNMAKWPELFKDQIANAGIVVISKSEQEDFALLNDIRDKVLRINPNAEVVINHYRTKPESWFKNIMEISATNLPIQQNKHQEIMEQISINDGSLKNIAELIVLLEDCLRNEFGQIARAKGVIPVGDQMIRFDLADQLYAITGTLETKSQCVFIGTNLYKQALYHRLGLTIRKRTYR